MVVSPAATVGELVVERPARTRVFEALGIDYCCAGKLSLERACQKAGLNPADVVRKLAEADGAGAGEAFDPSAMGLGALADHIEQSHHRFLRAELPRIGMLTEKVARAHGERDPRLVRVREVAAAFGREMFSHMMKEEQILFPMIRALEAGAGPGAFHCGSVANPIRQMEAEHEQSGDALAELRRLTDGFTPPPGACNTHRAMIDALADLERDTHQHVHKENNILFPGAIRKEREVGGGSV